MPEKRRARKAPAPSRRRQGPKDEKGIAAAPHGSLGLSRRVEQAMAHRRLTTAKDLTPQRPVRPLRPSCLRDASLAQPLQDALALLEVGRVVALRHAEKPGDRITGREGVTSPDLGPRLIGTTEMGKRGSHIEMAQRIVPAGVD